MKSWYKDHKILLTTSLFTFILCATLVWLSYVLFAGQPGARLIVSRVVFVIIVAQLLFLASLRRRYLLQIIDEFFSATTHPINLAVFRIAVFGTLFKYLITNNSRIVWFSEFPKELQFAPTGIKRLLPYIPINETLAKTCCILLLILCFTGMIGLFSRTSAFLSVILGFYVLGIPEFFGKVNHYHHLIWFPAILAASRCGDFFACDAILAAWKRADRGIVEPPSSSRSYALPLRFVWLLIGVIYFFPGFQKLWKAGFDWALTDSFKFLLYDKWFELNGWLPFFRLDRYPLIYESLALGSIFFEMAFIFLIFFPKLRTLTALAGIAFHESINAFMRISFWNLETCYVAFFDWNAIFLRLGGWLYQNEMYVVYDGNCKLCRRTIASLRMFDIFGRLTYVNALDNEALAKHGLLWLDSAAIMTDMHAVVQRKTWTGFSAYRALAARMVVFWPILPLLYVWPVPTIGNRIYRAVADSRTCSVAEIPLPKTAGYNSSPRSHLQVVTTLGIFLLFVNIFFGIKGWTHGWPFSCYPTFAYIYQPQKQTIEMVALSSKGETIPLDEQVISQQFSSERFMGIVRNILNSEQDPVQRRIRFTALGQLVEKSYSNLKQATSISLYEVTLWSAPERRKEKPVSRELMLNLKL